MRENSDITITITDSDHSVIDEKIFIKTPNVTNIFITDNPNLISIVANTFANLLHLKKITISNNINLEYIETCTFKNLNSVIEINIKNNRNLTKIRKYSFYVENQQSKLKKINIIGNSRLIEIDKCAFTNLNNLEEVYIYSNGIRNINAYIFYKCNKLNLISFYDNVFLKKIAKNFYNNENDGNDGNLCVLFDECNNIEYIGGDIKLESSNDAVYIGKFKQFVLPKSYLKFYDKSDGCVKLNESVKQIKVYENISDKQDCIIYTYDEDQYIKLGNIPPDIENENDKSSFYIKGNWDTNTFIFTSNADLSNKIQYIFIINQFKNIKTENKGTGNIETGWILKNDDYIFLDKKWYNKTNNGYLFGLSQENENNGIFNICNFCKLCQNKEDTIILIDKELQINVEWNEGKQMFIDSVNNEYIYVNNQFLNEPKIDSKFDIQVDQSNSNMIKTGTNIIATGKIGTGWILKPELDYYILHNKNWYYNYKSFN